MATSPPTPTVLIIDDHSLVGESLARALTTSGLRAHHVLVHSAADVLQQVRQHRPGLALLDLDLGRDPTGRRIDGAELVPALVPRWCVVVLSGTDNTERIGRALDAGARGALPKRAPLTAVVDAVRRGLRGKDVMHPEQRARLIAHYRTRRAEAEAVTTRLQTLTSKERDVLERLAQGRRAQEIADESMLALTTIRSHIRSVLTKLDVSSQLEAVAMLRHQRRG
jgi:NarL family two-component system response regulator LiaR